MPQQRIVFDSVYLSELTVGQYSELFDLAQLAISHPTTDAFFSTLVLRLRHSLNFDFVTLGLYDSSKESIHLDAWKAGNAQERCESIPVYGGASGWTWKNQRSLLVQDLGTELNSTTSPKGASIVSMAAIPDSLMSTVHPFNAPHVRDWIPMSTSILKRAWRRASPD